MCRAEDMCQSMCAADKCCCYQEHLGGPVCDECAACESAANGKAPSFLQVEQSRDVDPCEPKCQAKGCNSRADMGKPECEECAACELKTASFLQVEQSRDVDPCEPKCQAKGCNSRADMGKPECEECAACESKRPSFLVEESRDDKDGLRLGFQLCVHTSDKWGAGTDGTVRAKLKSPHGDTGYHTLDKSNHDDHERGKSNCYIVVTKQHHANPDRLCLNHEPNWLDWWHVKWVNVYTREGAYLGRATFDQWMYDHEECKDIN